jgi:hypothetical protein
MALLAILLNYRFMDMSHLQHCIKFFLVAEDTEFPTSTDKKILIPRRVIYMTEDASPFFCWSMGIFLTLEFFSLFMASKTELLTWIYFDQERKFRAMGVMALETFSLSYRLMYKILELQFMAEGTKCFISGNQLENMAIFHCYMTYITCFENYRTMNIFSFFVVSMAFRIYTACPQLDVR